MQIITFFSCPIHVHTGSTRTRTDDVSVDYRDTVENNL